MKTTHHSIIYSVLAALLLTFTMAGCSQREAAPSLANNARVPSHRITTVAYPLSHFARRLAGDSIEILTLTPPNDSFDSWRPKRAEILSMQQSDIIFVNGSAAPFATWLPHVTLPGSKICLTANEGLELTDMIAIEDIRIVHSHGPTGEHSHPTMVAYTWLDPAVAAKQIAIMASRLTDTYPNLKSSIAQAERELTNELASLSASIDEILSQKKNPISVLTNSPNLKFLTRALGLNDIHLDWKKHPNVDKAKIQLQEKIASVTPRPEFMLFTNEPTAEVRSVAESFNLRVIVTTPMAYEPLGSDYFRVMSKNLNQLKPIFGINPPLPKTNLSDSEQN